jgi:pimeloyl-ACP methyl ester carboxylesterase
MTSEQTTTAAAGAAGAAGGQHLRLPLLAGLPVTERRITAAGIDTAVLDGGEGPPVVLLHGPAEYAAKWMRVIPDLVRTHHVIAPDLPGHGTSGAVGVLTPERTLAWLGDLIAQTCPSPPALVGHLLGGAIAARFAIGHGEQVSHLVLVDSLGLTALQPDPEFGKALNEYLAAPSVDSHDGLWRLCAHDLEQLRTQMPQWDAFAPYNVDRARVAGAGAALPALMQHFGGPPIPPDELARIRVPTSLVWGRHDLATPLSVAEQASEAYGWPLHVIDVCADDPAVEQPEELVRALHVALGRTVTERRKS